MNTSLIATALLTLTLSGCSTITGDSNLVAFLRGDAFPDEKSSPQPRTEIIQAQAAQESHELTPPQASQRVIRGSKPSKYNHLSWKRSKGGSRDDSNEEQDKVSDNKTLCSAEVNPQFAYRKRVAVLPMNLQRQMDAIDLPHLSSQYPKELTRRIDQERFITLDSSQHPSLATLNAEHEAGKVLNPDKIKTAAKLLDAQFIVSGHFWDVSFNKTRFHPLHLTSSLHAWKDLGRKAYQNSTGSFLRQMNVDISLYDGSTGALIEQKQYQGEAHHQVETNAYRFGSNTFWRSEYGKLTSKFLDQQSDMIENALACIPLRAKIVAVNKRKLEINVGRNSFLLPGDKLQVLHKAGFDSGWRTDGSMREHLQRVGSLTITQVYPMRAMAVIDSELPRNVIIQPGDIVQAW